VNARFAAVVVVAAAVAACGGPDPLQGWNATLVPTSECTLTGDASRDCEDEAVLAARSTSGRWIFERGDDATTITITTHEGRTIPGLLFNNDLSVIDADGCRGEGGLCAFTRRRFTSTDDNNLGCTRFGELIAMGHFDPDDDAHFVGAFSDVNGNDENCGTPTVNEVVFAVDAVLVDDPVLARTVEAR
jgi:hypothetical protein